MSLSNNIFGKSLLAGLFFFLVNAFGQGSPYVNSHLENTGIQNAVDLEEAANNALDQLQLKYIEVRKKLEDNNPGSIQRNIILSALRKTEEYTNSQNTLIQKMSDKCWDDKGFDPSFFTKNLELIAKKRDTAIGDYGYFATMRHSKKKYVHLEGWCLIATDKCQEFRLDKGNLPS